jgi:hypothetical protein
MAWQKLRYIFSPVPKEAFRRKLISEFSSVSAVDLKHILVGDVPLPSSTDRYSPIWIPFFEPSQTVVYGQLVCSVVIRVFEEHFASNWSGIEMFLGFMRDDVFQKTYRLSLFKPEIESVTRQLSSGFPGRHGTQKRGELFGNEIGMQLIDD